MFKFTCYISDRSQNVLLNSAFSWDSFVSPDVSQGNLLDAFLSILFANDLSTYAPDPSIPIVGRWR